MPLRSALSALTDRLTTPPPAPPPSRFKRSLRPLGLIVAFYILVFALLVVFQGIARAAFGESATDSRGVLAQWNTLAATVIATFVMLRRVEKLPWSTIGLDRAAAAPRVLLKGASYGVLVIGAASLSLIAVQQLRIVPTPDGSWWGIAGRATA